MEISRPVEIPYPGGKIIMSPEYEFVSERTGENVKLDPCIRATGLGKIDVKLTPEFIDALTNAYTRNKTFRAFVDKVRKFQAQQLDGSEKQN